MTRINNKKKLSNIPKKIVYVDDAPVFKFINPNANSELSKMSGIDLQDLLTLIDDYYIQLRSKLGFEEYITFGLELEFENAILSRIDSRLIEAFPNEEWSTKNDNSLHKGAEIDSPILRDTPKNWENLDKVCSIVEPFAIIGDRSGGHIHIGTQTLGNDRNSWLNFLKLWSVYENIIFRFAYGNFITARPSIKEYAEPMTKDFWKYYKKLKSENASLESIIYKISQERYQAVNFRNVNKEKCNKFGHKNTIEFRCPNGSLDAAIWQNNVNLFVKMLSYSRSRLFNDSLVEQRHELNLEKFSNLKWYDEIFLEQALEFCDLVFSNNFDKVYFLRQYLKSFEVNYSSNKYSKVRKLSKTGIKNIN